MGRAGPRPILSNFDGPGRAAAHEMWDLYARLRPAHEAAHVFDEPARTAAHEIWGTTATINNTTTTSTVPMRRPMCFDGPARAVAYAM